MHKTLHLWDDIDRLYVSRKERRRGLASIEDNVDTSLQWLGDYIEKHEGGLITGTRNDTEKTLMWLRKGNLKKETESLLIAAQKPIISKQEYIRCGDRDETINHKISECSKLA